MALARRIDPDEKLDLSNIPTKEDGGLEKDEARARLSDLGKRMAELQELLFAARRHSLLIVLQGRDTSGKDGSIRRILDYVNVQSTRVVPFKVPTDLERSHDFLWRVHGQAPGLGDVTIFNRSHYEDVLVVRVHELVPKEVWRKRYEHINAFEKLLTDANTIVLKFYLHISKEEQEERLLEREKEPEKAWKLSVGDWKERELWEGYTAAYEDALAKCSTENAPWYVIPADRKWYRDLALFETIVGALEPFEEEWKRSLKELGERQSREIREYRENSK